MPISEEERARFSVGTKVRVDIEYRGYPEAVVVPFSETGKNRSAIEVQSWIWVKYLSGNREGDYNGHTPEVLRIINASQSKALNCQNNDGRETCYACNAPTRTVQGFSSVYTICVECGK